MMLFVLPEAQLPTRDTKGLNSLLHTTESLLIYMLICFKTLTNLLQTPWSSTVTLYIVLFLAGLEGESVLAD